MSAAYYTIETKLSTAHNDKLFLALICNGIFVISITMQLIIQFFIYLRAELNRRWPITESARNIKQTIQ
jgi:hypothetical protein